MTMGGLIEAFGGKGRSVVDRFEEQVADKPIEEVRRLELQLLKPEPMIEPSCPQPTARGVIDTKVAFYLPPRRYWRLFKKFFKVSQMGERSNGKGIPSGEKSVRDISIILALLDGLIDKSLVYNSDTKSLYAAPSPVLDTIKERCNQLLEIEQDTNGTSLAESILALIAIAQK
jgi:hypothetical protein